jgi:hypothetical protein
MSHAAKSSAIPAVRVEPVLRQHLEAVLAEGETVSAFVESAVREQIRLRQQQAEFVARGLAAVAVVKAGGPSVPVAAALAKLQARVDKARQPRR